MYLHYFVIVSPWKKVWPFIWTNINLLHPRMLCAKFGWNWPSGFGEEDFLISSMYFRYFVIISPWIGTGPFIWTNLNPLHPRMLCAKFGWNWPSGFGEEDFLISSMYFRYFAIISPWRRLGPFIWTNLNPHHPRMLCAGFGWNWASGSWFLRRLVFAVSQLFSLGKGRGPSFEQLESSSPKYAMCQIWLKLAQWF